MPGRPLIALMGQVPVKATTENGPIQAPAEQTSFSRRLTHLHLIVQPTGVVSLISGS